MNYAEIVIANANENLDRVFHYGVPENLRNIIEVGMRVYVPFGKGNHRTEGYVIGFTDEIDFDKSKIKNIYSMAESYVVISQKRLQLAYWMKEKYYCSIGSAIMAITPKIVKEKAFKCVSVNKKCENLSEKIQQVLKKQTKQKVVLEMLLNGSVVPVSHIKNLLGVTDSPIDSLVKKGVLVIENVQTYRGNCNFEYRNRTIAPILNEEQTNAVNVLNDSIDNQNTKPILIKGVTGSGKTEVYMAAIERALQIGKQCIVLVPEISLTPQTVDRFVSRFGDKVAVTHSRLSDGERYDQWNRARKNEISVMIGPRSAIFTPFENLGLVVIDEEHETTYKSDQQSPKFDAREVAEKLGELYNSVTVLGSATPSITSFYKAKHNIYKLVQLNNRVNNAYPDVKIVDMRSELAEGNKSIFSRDLQYNISKAISNGEQIILFLNRRGFSNFVSCRSCGHVMKCNDCNVNYTFHKSINKLMCHYCGKIIQVPTVCPECGSKYIRHFGSGTEKIQQEVEKLFPKARTLRMDLDTTTRKNSHQTILEKFRNQEADILIGTQMIAKGLDFPNVSLVGVISADLSLNSGDYNSSENTFQLVTQVAGRAGRADVSGKVIIQTYNPENYCIQYAAKNDYIDFYNEEIEYRRQLKYPPFGNFFVVLFTGVDYNLVVRLLEELHFIMEHYNKNNQFTLLGPMPATISKINNKYRYQIVVKSTEETKLKNYVLYCLNKLKTRQKLDKINIGLYLNPNHSV